MAGEVNVGTVTGKVELDAAGVAATLGEVNTKLDLLSNKLDKGNHSVKEMAEGFITAQEVMKLAHEAAHLVGEELEYLVVEGGKAADVRDAFDHLTEGADLLGDVLLTKVRAGTQGMVEDVDIMQRVNSDLAAGLKLTTEQYELIATASFKLAQAERISVKDAFDRVSDAMVTGRTRGIALLTGRIDQTAAEEKYAKTLHTTADLLTAEEKVEAQRVAILGSLTGASARLGESTLNLGDRLEQAQVKLVNFNNEIGMAVADSPVLTAGWDAASAAFADAFSGDKVTMVQAITGAIEEGAVILVDFGITAAAVLEGVVGVVMIAVGAMQVFEGSLLAIYDFSQGNFQAAKADLVVGFKTIADAATGQTSLQKAIEKTEAGLFAARDAMKAAQAQAEAERAATEGLGESHKKAAGDAGAHKKAEEEVAGAYRMSKDEIKKMEQGLREMSAVGATWRETVQGISGDTVEAVKYYLQAGIAQDKLAAVYQLTDVQVKAVAEDLKAEVAGHQLLTAAIEKHQAAEQSLLQTRLELKQNSLKTQLDADVAALDARYEKGVVSETTYQATLYALKTQYASQSEALYRQQATSEEQVIADKLAKELQDLEASYAQGKIDTEDYEKTKSLLAATSADERAAIEEKYTADRKARLDAANADAAASFGSLGHAGKQAFELISEGAAALGSDIDNLNKKVLTLDGTLMDAVKFKEQLDKGGSTDVTSQNFDQEIRNLITSGGWNPTGAGLATGVSVQRAYQLAREGYSFQEIWAIMNNTGGGPVPPPHGPRIPGFREGGIGDFGDGTMAMLHGHEAIVPLDRATGGLGGNVTIAPGAIVLQYPLINDRNALGQLGRVVGEGVMVHLRNSGYRVS